MLSQQRDTYGVIKRYAQRPTDRNFLAVKLLASSTQMLLRAAGIQIAAQLNIQLNKGVPAAINDILGRANKELETALTVDAKSIYENTLRAAGFKLPQ